MIHALEESVEPARAAFRSGWPEAETFDLLDTSLAADLAHAGQLDAQMMERFHTLADYAHGTVGRGGKTAAILFTCSAFGPAIEAVKARLPIPVLRPNEAAFEQAVAHANRIGLVVTFGPSLEALIAELHAVAQSQAKPVRISAAIAEGALAALKRGEGEEHDRRALAAARTLDHVDLLVLGQFSLARAQHTIAAALDKPVLTTPGTAVAALRGLLSSPASFQKGP